MKEFDLTLVYIIGPIAVVIICIVSCWIAYYRCFVLDRTKAPVYILPIKYFTEHPDVVLDNIKFKSSIGKLRRRKQRLRRLNMFLRSKRIQPHDEDSKEIDDEDNNDGNAADDRDIENAAIEFEDNSNESRPRDRYASSKSSILRRSLLFLRSSFLNLMAFEFSHDEASTGQPGKKLTKKRKKTRSGSLFSEASAEVSVKSKRFISQDRLDRAEARKALTAMAVEDTEPEVAEEEVMNIDERERRVQAIIERRKRQREEDKLQAAERGIVDVVALNAGPRPHEIPKGFSVVEFIKELDPEYLNCKRVLYKYEEVNRNGWFLGTIIGTTKAVGKNFSIKYDRAETGTRFVDGMETVSLALEGENAYSRRWVIIEWTDPGPRPGKILAILAKNEALNSPIVDINEKKKKRRIEKHKMIVEKV